MDEVERIARSLCRADGYEPDEPANRGDVRTFVTPGAVFLDRDPMWTLYRDEAEALAANLPSPRN